MGLIAPPVAAQYVVNHPCRHTILSILFFLLDPLSKSEFLYLIEVIRVELNRIDETLDQLRREGPSEWNAERDVASHMFSEIEINWKRKD